MREYASGVRCVRLYEVAENKLMAFFGYIGSVSSNTRFLVYSHGSSEALAEWAEEPYRYDWAAEIERRLPSLTGRICTMHVPGGKRMYVSRRSDSANRETKRPIDSRPAEWRLRNEGNRCSITYPILDQPEFVEVRSRLGFRE